MKIKYFYDFGDLSAERRFDTYTSRLTFDRMSFFKKRFLFCPLFFFFVCCAGGFQSLYAQRADADSIYQRLQKGISDSERIVASWNMAYALLNFKPDSALFFGNEALTLARKTGDRKGESRALGAIAVVLNKMGNYPKALAFQLENLKIEEQRNSPEDLLSVYVNLGIVYSRIGDFNNALKSYRQGEVLANQLALPARRYGIALNIGDLYDRNDKPDSAFQYYSKSLQLATLLNDTDRVGKSKLGLANVYRKTGNYALGLHDYREAISFLEYSGNEDALCEALLGIAIVFNLSGSVDSAIRYGKRAYELARKDQFLSPQLDAALQLADWFALQHKMDSAYAYLSEARGLRDSLAGVEKIRSVEQITLNENLRQFELAAQREREKEERFQQLQLILIGMFIPTLFFITVLLSRIRISIRLIRFLGVISLLFFFEYITLLLHPRVVEWTHHNPVLEILIFVAFAGLLIPLHHKLEHLMIELLVRRAKQHEHEIPVATKKATPSADEPVRNEQAIRAKKNPGKHPGRKHK